MGYQSFQHQYDIGDVVCLKQYDFLQYLIIAFFPLYEVKYDYGYAQPVIVYKIRTQNLDLINVLEHELRLFKQEEPKNELESTKTELTEQEK